MDVRDAVEADAEALAAVGDAPADVMRNLVHDRTVRVALRADTAEAEGTTADEVLGYISFDAREGTVHVTQIAGDVATRSRLLDEPVRFATGEGMAVELIVGVDDEPGRTAAERAGFERDGAGPTFDGEPTVRYRLDPDETDATAGG